MDRTGAVLVALSLLMFAGNLVHFGTTTIGIGPAQALAAQKTPEQLEAEIDRESNPKKRLSLAVDLMEQRTKLLLDAFDSQDSEKESRAVEDYLSAADRLEKAMNDNTSLGAAKSAEIRLRKQNKTLTDLRMSLSASDQETLAKAVARLTRLHELLLNSIMHPRK